MEGFADAHNGEMDVEIHGVSGMAKLTILSKENTLSSYLKTTVVFFFCLKLKEMKL